MGELYLKIKELLKKSVSPIALTLSVVTALQFLSCATVKAEKPTEKNEQEMYLSLDRKNGYNKYLEKYKDMPRPDQEIIIRGEKYKTSKDMDVNILHNFKGGSGNALETQEFGTVEWEIDIEKEGLYNIAIKYFPIEGKSSSIEREILIDGEIPFNEGRQITFPRMWANEKKDTKVDKLGNDIRPTQVENPMWSEKVLKDEEGKHLSPYLFYFSKGKHTIALNSVREPMAIEYIRLFQYKEPIEYSKLKQEYDKKGFKNSQGVLKKIQGEDANIKSSPTLYPTTDRSSPMTEPYNVTKMKINTIGGNGWNKPGQWIKWNFEVPQDGLYKIGIKYKQNAMKGSVSSRVIKIDGGIPFKEASDIRFEYNDDWEMKELSQGDDPYLFYLTKGNHEIEMEVTMGEMAPIVSVIENSIYELNRIYRKVIMITGAVPDPYRDYRIEKQIPEMTEVFRSEGKTLSDIAKYLEKDSGGKSEKSAIISTVAYQLKDLAEKPESIAQRLDSFKINIGALGTWLLSMPEQPLEIDYIVVASPDETMPKAKATFIKKLGHELKSFYYSFFEDYNQFGDIKKKSNDVTVWVSTGRDQIHVLKNMIEDDFTSKTGIKINLQLVDSGVILPATLSGKGPDIALQMDGSVPINYGMRNALEDLSKFQDFNSIKGRFRESAFVPYEFNGGVYALPEQQIFPMLFYRKDILEELKLDIPQTWQDVYNMIPILQNNHMEFGIPATVQGTFAMLLYQNGGNFYKNDGKSSDLDSEISLKAFNEWTELYTNYKFPLSFDFVNRFRIGEMPIGIADYSIYNTLNISAPEIRGLWDFTSVPGTIKNEEINRQVASSGSCSVMFKNTDCDKEDAWEFMKWWTGKNAQLKYGREMEALMGPAARYPTANIEALSELPWPVKDYRNLDAQWEWVMGVPEVPGSYFTGRHMDNAFREVVNEGEDTRETLYKYVKVINEEIDLKRDEFGLPLEGR